jgi:hypothetical protein
MGGAGILLRAEGAPESDSPISRDPHITLVSLRLLRVLGVLGGELTPSIAHDMSIFMFMLRNQDMIRKI